MKINFIFLLSLGLTIFFLTLFIKPSYAIAPGCDAYDFNKDGAVNGADESFVSNHFGLNLGDTGYQQIYDVNSDTHINQADLNIVIACANKESVGVTSSGNLGDAKSVDTGIGKISTDPSQLTNTLLRIVIGLAGGITFLLIIYGGFRLVFSQGDPKAVQEGRDIITSAIVGLVIIIMAVFILRLVGVDVLGLPI